MKTSNKTRLYTLDEIKDELIGNPGTQERIRYERELQLEVLGDMIKQVRIERQLTQEQLGKLIGIQKSQISKLENNATNVTVDTLLKVFHAMKATVIFTVELQKKHVNIA